MNNKQMDKWLKERDQAVLSFNVKTFKKFIRKWQGIVYEPNMQLPSDEVLAISIRKMALAITSATFEQREQAAEWLLKRGYDLDMFNKE